MCRVCAKFGKAHCRRAASARLTVAKLRIWGSTEFPAPSCAASVRSFVQWCDPVIGTRERSTDYDSLEKCGFVESFRLSVSQMWAKLQTSERPHPQLPVAFPGRVGILRNGATVVCFKCSGAHS